MSKRETPTHRSAAIVLAGRLGIAIIEAAVATPAPAGHDRENGLGIIACRDTRGLVCIVAVSHVEVHAIDRSVVSTHINLVLRGINAEMLDPANVSVISDMQVVTVARLVEDGLDDADTRRRTQKLMGLGVGESTGLECADVGHLAAVVVLHCVERP
eukprot:COSAG06_NODE_23966_length_676_cov_1.019064_1_plen_156_part_10